VTELDRSCVGLQDWYLDAATSSWKALICHVEGKRFVSVPGSTQFHQTTITKFKRFTHNYL